MTFQPTLPVRGVTLSAYTSCIMSRFQPTLPVRGVTQQGGHVLLAVEISTHTPRAGSDHAVRVDADHLRISTHTPRAGSDRGARYGHDANKYFNPHSPCGE